MDNATDNTNSQTDLDHGPYCWGYTDPKTQKRVIVAHTEIGGAVVCPDCGADLSRPPNKKSQCKAHRPAITAS